MAAALRRSDVSFRSQGSSGVVWSNMFYSGELNKIATREYTGEITEVIEPPGVQRSKSATADGTADHVSPPSFDPPSPKLSGCALMKGDYKSDVSKRVLQIVASMKRDWMQIFKI
nr:nudix hydrolase 19, chloroplastic [Ipomoea batatas]